VQAVEKGAWWGADEAGMVVSVGVVESGVVRMEVVFEGATGEGAHWAPVVGICSEPYCV
jgi:hypothetical protein